MVFPPDLNQLPVLESGSKLGLGAGPKGSKEALLEHHSTMAARETEGCCLAVDASVVDPGSAAGRLVVESAAAAAAAAPTAAALKKYSAV